MIDNLKANCYDVEYLDDGKVLLNFSNGKKIRATPILETIIRKFDGTKDIDEIVNELNDEGFGITNDDLYVLIESKLSKIGIFEDVCKNEQLKFWFHFPIINGDRIKLPFPKFMFNPVLIAFLSVTYCIFAFSVLMEFKLDTFVDSLVQVDYFIFFVIVSILFIIHELGHIEASKFFGCKVGNVGVGIYMFRPVVYVNLSDSWRLSNKKRLIIDFSGIYFQMISGIIIYLALLIYNWSITINALFIFNLFLIIFNLNPFLRLDGYWILSDWLDEPNIHARAVRLVNEMFDKTIYGRKRSYVIRENKYVKVYSLAYVLLNLSLIFWGIIRVFRIIISKMNLFQSMRLLIFEELASIQKIEIGTNLILDILSVVYMILLIFRIIRKYKNKL